MLYSAIQDTEVLTPMKNLLKQYKHPFGIWICLMIIVCAVTVSRNN